MRHQAHGRAAWSRGHPSSRHSDRTRGVPEQPRRPLRPGPLCDQATRDRRRTARSSKAPAPTERPRPWRPLRRHRRVAPERRRASRGGSTWTELPRAAALMHSPKVPRPAWRADTNDTARPGRSRRESGTVLEARSYLSNADRLPSVAGVAVTPGSRSGMGDFSIFHMADRLGRFYGGDPARPKRLAGRNLTP